MSIQYDENKRVITLKTINTAWQMQIDARDNLLHLHYGTLIDEPADHLIRHLDSAFAPNPGEEAMEDSSYSLDALPQEYPTFGTGDFRSFCLKVRNADGSSSTELHYLSHRILKGKYRLPEPMPSVYANEDEAETLEITLADRYTGLRAVLLYAVLPERDVITRSVRIENGGNSVVELQRVYSACLDFMCGDYDLIHFSGKHAGERQMQRTAPMSGSRSINSRRGVSSHQQNPFIILADPETNEDAGSCWGMMLMWSGSFFAEAEVDQFGATRALIGAGGETFFWPLQPGESFWAPEVILIYSDQGLTRLSQRYHHLIRHHVCHGKYQLSRRPVLINNWEATMFQFDHDKLLDIARQAAALGVELFVLDDGWFSTRQDDRHGLGDWTVNETKLPGSLKRLADDINHLGLKFGLWIEPEMVNEDTRIFREHPEWVLCESVRPPKRGRHQMVLDFSRKDVVDAIFEQISAVLDQAHIEYIKWDMNRSLTDIFSHALSPDDQGKTEYLYVLGVYDMLNRLTSRYPDLLLEGCSGGGGRFDAGMLYYEPQIWCSDNTDAINRLGIQYGTSFGYPAACMGAHVSEVPNQQNGRITPFETRALVAMSGTFGFELDLNRLSDEEKEKTRQSIETFKQNWNVIQNGDLYRLSEPFGRKSYASWMFVLPDQSEALLNLVTTRLEGNQTMRCLCLKGLNPERHYRLEVCSASAPLPRWMDPTQTAELNHITLSGRNLLFSGICLPLAWGDYASWQLHLSAVD